MGYLTRGRPRPALSDTICAIISQGKVYFGERLEAERPINIANVFSFSLLSLAISTKTTGIIFLKAIPTALRRFQSIEQKNK
jgi:hypothetical protein